MEQILGNLTASYDTKNIWYTYIQVRIFPSKTENLKFLFRIRKPIAACFSLLLISNIFLAGQKRQ